METPLIYAEWYNMLDTYIQIVKQIGSIDSTQMGGFDFYYNPTLDNNNANNNANNINGNNANENNNVNNANGNNDDNEDEDDEDDEDSDDEDNEDSDDIIYYTVITNNNKQASA